VFELESSNATGVARIRELNTADTRLTSAGVTDMERLANELRLVGSLYAENILTNNDVALGLRDELPAALDESLIVLRPGNRVLVHRDVQESAAIIYSNNNTPDDPSDDVPDTVYF